MPKDAHLLSPMNQALLQAARAGTVHKPPPVEEEVKEAGEEEEEKVVDRGFTTRRWAPVPRHLEGPEPEYLAKKRKGLVSATPANAVQIGPEDMRKTKVRRVDSDGNSYVTEVIAAQGQKVEGDIIEETLLTDGAAPGTIVEGLGVVNAEGVVVVDGSAQMTPQRKRPPPPRRKPKGPGRGRKKKKLQFALDPTIVTTDENGVVISGTNSQGDLMDPHKSGVDGDDADANDEDMEMADGNEDDEDDEDGEEDDDAEEDDEHADDVDLPAFAEADEAMKMLEPPLDAQPGITSQPSKELGFDDLSQHKRSHSPEQLLESLDAPGEEDAISTAEAKEPSLSNEDVIPVLPEPQQRIDETPAPYTVQEASIPESLEPTLSLSQQPSVDYEQPAAVIPQGDVIMEEPSAVPAVEELSTVPEVPSSEAYAALASLEQSSESQLIPSLATEIVREVPPPYSPPRPSLAQGEEPGFSIQSDPVPSPPAPSVEPLHTTEPEDSEPKMTLTSTEPEQSIPKVEPPANSEPAALDLVEEKPEVELKDAPAVKADEPVS